LFCGGGVVRVMSPLVAGTGGKRKASGAVLAGDDPGETEVAAAYGLRVYHQLS
jgi:hypothetical protein